MTPAETSFIIEQNRLTHAKIDAVHKDLRDHIVQDQQFYAMVRKHDEDIRWAKRLVRWTWIALVALGSMLGVSVAK